MYPYPTCINESIDLDVRILTHAPTQGWACGLNCFFIFRRPSFDKRPKSGWRRYGASGYKETATAPLKWNLPSAFRGTVTWMRMGRLTKKYLAALSVTLMDGGYWKERSCERGRNTALSRAEGEDPKRCHLSRQYGVQSSLFASDILLMFPREAFFYVVFCERTSIDIGTLLKITAVISAKRRATGLLKLHFWELMRLHRLITSRPVLINLIDILVCNLLLVAHLNITIAALVAQDMRPYCCCSCRGEITKEYMAIGLQEI